MYYILYIIYYVLYYIILYPIFGRMRLPQVTIFFFNSHGMPIPTRLILLVMARPFTRWTLTVDV